MRKWLRSWFAWRFSLTRLVVAVVFLGAVVGLNMRSIGPTAWPTYRPAPTTHWGWPFPFSVKWDQDFAFIYFIEDGRPVFDNTELDARWYAAESYRLPLSHRTYRLLNLVGISDWFPSKFALILCAIIDALFALAVLSLILFFHPRLNPPNRPLAHSASAR